MLPYFFRHYRPLVDHFFIYDNGSTDGSLELLAGEDHVTVSHFDVSGDSFVDEERRLSDTIWQGSRSVADWVIVVDIDEHLYHSNLRGYLRNCAAQGITAITAVGYEMLADDFPTTDAPLWQDVTLGCRFLRDFDKLCIFDPNAIETVNFAPGRHYAAPTGRVSYPEKPAVKLLHYKKLGIEYLQARWAELRTGLRSGDLAAGYGLHYLTPPAEVQNDFEWRRRMARTVPGLAVKSDNGRSLDVHLQVHGENIYPQRVERSVYKFSLAPDAPFVWLVSEPLNAKHLMVGIPVLEIILRKGKETLEIPVDSVLLSRGWWHPTRLFDQVLRWTDGRALIELPETADRETVLEIELAERMIAAWA